MEVLTLQDDTTKPIITAEFQVKNVHPNWNYTLPKVAVIFFMSKGVEYLSTIVDSYRLDENFPCMLDDKPIYVSKDPNICFLYGGAGAPQAADTIETLAVLGVDTIIAVGMFGTFSSLIQVGELVAPNRAFVEEGTSRHYYEDIISSAPDVTLHNLALEVLSVKSCPIVSTDAVYRETYQKEECWRSEGALGSDMETSAIFSVSAYLGMKSVALLIASDCHPQDSSSNWKWAITDEMKRSLVENSFKLVQAIVDCRMR